MEHTGFTACPGWKNGVRHNPAWGNAGCAFTSGVPRQDLVLVQAEVNRKEIEIVVAPHDRRDVTFHEDAIHLTVGQAEHNMAILTNLVIGLCLFQDFHNLAQARPHEALLLNLTALASILLLP